MPSKVCPLMSSDQGNGLCKVYCLGAECQFYVEESEQCFVQEALDYLDIINTSLMIK